MVVTWDEDDYSEANKVLTFLLDPHESIFPKGSVDKTLYVHNDYRSLSLVLSTQSNTHSLPCHDAHLHHT